MCGFTSSYAWRILTLVMRNARVTEHGLTGYTRKCRCRVCRRAWADYYTARRRRLGIRARSELQYYHGPRAGISASLTPLGAQILATAASRTGRGKSDIMEAALRIAGPALGFEVALTM